MVLGADGALWLERPDIALAIFATMPSGLEAIVAARSRLSAASFGPGWSQPGKSLPTVLHQKEVTVPLAISTVYIGNAHVNGPLSGVAMVQSFHTNIFILSGRL